MILIFYCSQYLATSTCVWFMLKYTVYVKDLCGNFQKFYDVDTLHPFNLMPTIFLSLILIIKQMKGKYKNNNFFYRSLRCNSEWFSKFFFFFEKKIIKIIEAQPKVFFFFFFAKFGKCQAYLNIQQSSPTWKVTNA